MLAVVRMLRCSNYRWGRFAILFQPTRSRRWWSLWYTPGWTMATAARRLMCSPQSVLIIAARLHLRPSDSISSALISLHWLWVPPNEYSTESQCNLPRFFATLRRGTWEFWTTHSSCRCTRSSQVLICRYQPMYIVFQMSTIGSRAYTAVGLEWTWQHRVSIIHPLVPASTEDLSVPAIFLLLAL